MASSRLFNTPPIDPRSELQLTNAAKGYAFRESGGVINANNLGDYLDVLIRTQAYVGGEIKNYVSGLPAAFAETFLRNLGVVRSLGTKARAPVTFTLVATRPAPFFIQKGFEVRGSDSSGTYSFYTVEDLVIPAGNLSGVADVEAREVGERYNLAAGLINNPTQSLQFLQSMINLQPAAGGSNPESSDSAVARAVEQLSLRNPVSVRDFERYAENIMGAGSRALCIPLLGLDKVTSTPGCEHLFLLTAGAQPANTATIALVRSQLTPRLMAGSQLHISPMDVFYVRAELIAKLSGELTPAETADRIWRRYQQYLDPTTYPAGTSVQIEEVRARLRFAGGLEYIEELYLNGDTLSVGMPNPYTIPTARGMVLRLIDDSGAELLELRGEVA